MMLNAGIILIVWLLFSYPPSERHGDNLPRDRAKATDEELILLFLDGDSNSFARLYERHRAGLRRYLAHCGSCEDAGELSQTTWMKLIDTMTSGNYDTDRPFLPFLYTVARNLLRDRQRKYGREVFAGELPEAHCSAHDVRQIPLTPEQFAVSAEMGRALRECIGELPPAQRETLLLRAEADLSYNEIVEITGVQRETVKARLRYARGKLAECMARKGFALLAHRAEAPCGPETPERPVP